MTYRNLFVACILIVFSCNQSKHNTSINDTSKYENVGLVFDTSSITIFNINSAQSRKNFRTANLSQEDIYKLDNFVKLALNDLNKKTEIMRKEDSLLNPNLKMSERYYRSELKDLKRQYVPYMNDKSETIVLIICFKTDTAIPTYYKVWKTELYPSRIGGHHAFRFIVNLSKSNYIEIRLNGAG